ncbi:MAG: DUF4347 domain-containing protein, partial [Desulfobacula sp.]|nr:DUF4347 domain-containing protein [Desulfobacula sp.]
MCKKEMINCLAWVLCIVVFVLNGVAFGNVQALSEIVFIDPSVPQAEMIVAQLPENAEVVRLSPGMEAIAQISARLAKKVNLSTIRIISHGNEGYFVLNGTRIDNDFLQEQGSRVAPWGRALAENGDILLYACNLAATNEGKAFVGKLSDLTGADIAASIDITGGEIFKGNWSLEYEIGQIDTIALTIEPDIDIKLREATWDGGGGSGGWTTATNWDTDTAPVDGVDSIIIPDAATTPIDPNYSVSDTYTAFTIQASGILNITGGAINSSGSFTNNGTVNAAGAIDISITATNDINLNGAITSATGSVTFDSGADGIDIDGASTITSTSGTITFSDIIDGANTLGVDAGTGLIDFQGIIGGAAPPTTLTITQSGGTTFQGNVTTATSIVLTDTVDAANITFTGALVTPTLTTTGEAYDIDLHGGCTITSDTSFSNTGTTTIGNGSGDSSTFTGGLDAEAGAVSIAGTVATTNQNIDFGATTLNSDTTLNSGGGNIAMTTLAGGSKDLTIAAGTAGGTTTVSGAVTALGDGTGAALTLANGVTGLVTLQST